MTSMMRVVIFDELWRDRPYSFQVFLEQMVRELEAEGVEYRIVSPRWRIVGARSQWRHLVVSSLLRQIVYPIAARRHLSGDHLNFLASGGLVHLLWCAPRAARTVVFCHDMFPLLPPAVLGHRLDFGAAVRRTYLRLVQARALERATLIIAPSRSTKSDLVAVTRVAPDRVIVIPHRVDRDMFHPGCKQDARRRLGWPLDDRIVLAVVTTERRKNVEGLLSAFAIIARKDSCAALVLVGRLSDRQRRLVNATGVAGRIRLLSGLTTTELAEIYRAADCLAHLSFYEGFGYPVLEAMASGCPIVCSPGGALREVAGDCAVLVDPHAPEAAARTVVDLLADAQLQQTLRTRGLERANAFAGDRGYADALRRAWNAS